MYDRNWWAARDNVIRENRIVRSGRADLALGGPASFGNCFAGNQYAVAAPAGLELLHGCAGLRLPLGFDPLPLVSTVGYRGFTAAHRTFPDWRGQPVPPPQPVMPNATTAPARPAVGVFEGLRFDPARAQLPAGAEAVLRATPTNVRPMVSPGPAGRALSSATFWLMPLLLLAWITRGRRRPIRFGLGALAVYLAVLAVTAVIYGRF
jgi:hypothetical protein